MKRGRYDIGARCGATVLRFWDFAGIRAVIVATLQQPLYPPGGGEGSGERGRVCEDEGAKIGQYPGTVILPFSGTVTLPRNIVFFRNGVFGKML